MAQLPDTKALSADAVANRLRLLQMDLADEEAPLRQEQLAEELDRALAARTPEQRKAFLEGLLARFPTWDRPGADLDAAAHPAGRSPTDERELADPSFLVSRLVELAPEFSDEQRRLLVRRLTQADLLPESDGPALDKASAAKLLSKLQLAVDDRIDSRRMLSLVSVLMEFALSLDQVVWRTWQEVAPRADIRRKTQLRQQMGRYVTGDQKVSGKDVAQNLDALRQLVAGMIAAIGQVGQQFASKYASHISPEEIESLVRMEKRWHEGPAAACWRKYKELAGGMDPTSIERDIKQVIADYTASLIKGLGS